MHKPEVLLAWALVCGLATACTQVVAADGPAATPAPAAADGGAEEAGSPALAEAPDAAITFLAVTGARDLRKLYATATDSIIPVLYCKDDHADEASCKEDGAKAILEWQRRVGVWSAANIRGKSGIRLSRTWGLFFRKSGDFKYERWGDTVRDWAEDLGAEMAQSTAQKRNVLYVIKLIKDTSFITSDACPYTDRELAQVAKDYTLTLSDPTSRKRACDIQKERDAFQEGAGGNISNCTMTPDLTYTYRLDTFGGGPIKAFLDTACLHGVGHALGNVDDIHSHETWAAPLNTGGLRHAYLEDPCKSGNNAAACRTALTDSSSNSEQARTSLMAYGWSSLGLVDGTGPEVLAYERERFLRSPMFEATE